MRDLDEFRPDADGAGLGQDPVTRVALQHVLGGDVVPELLIPGEPRERYEDARRHVAVLPEPRRVGVGLDTLDAEVDAPEAECRPHFRRGGGRGRTVRLRRRLFGGGGNGEPEEKDQPAGARHGYLPR